jgi:7-cyano-7-deazaguanine synthase
MIYGTAVTPTPVFPIENERVIIPPGLQGTQFPQDLEIPIPREDLVDSVPIVDAKEPDGVVIVSGGLDSITTVYRMVQVHNATPHLISFDYGQRHSKELDYALACAERLGLRWSLVELSTLTDLISNSALTSQGRIIDDPDQPGYKMGSEILVPEGHYSEDNMAITVVPNRNMVMISIAAAIAVNNKYKYVAAGMHAGDHAQYPDCRPGFLKSVRETIMWANEGFIDPNFELLTPYIRLSKNDIAADAYRFGVPLHMTWSCYKGGAIHCGRCATCVERQEAIASVKEAPADWDQTLYADSEFWKQTVADWHQQHST